MDEFDAHSSQNNGGWPKNNTSRWCWQHPNGATADEKKSYLISALLRAKSYSKLPTEPTNNKQIGRVQNCSSFACPYVKRPKTITRWY